MIFQLKSLDRTTSHFLPDDCRGCGWWQGREGGWPSPAEREAWERRAEELFGGWGKLALMDDRPLGMIQYGPSVLFPGMEKLPCGPLSTDAMLISCSRATDDSLPALRKSLLLAALAALQELEVEAVEAFCSCEQPQQHPGHLFESELLRESGFYPARSSNGVQLMRLELGGIERSGEHAQRHRHRLRLLERIKRPAPAPSPVTPCRGEADGCSRLADLKAVSGNCC